MTVPLLPEVTDLIMSVVSILRSPPHYCQGFLNLYIWPQKSSLSLMWFTWLFMFKPTFLSLLKAPTFQLTAKPNQLCHRHCCDLKIVGFTTVFSPHTTSPVFSTSNCYFLNSDQLIMRFVLVLQPKQPYLYQINDIRSVPQKNCPSFHCCHLLNIKELLFRLEESVSETLLVLLFCIWSPWVLTHSTLSNANLVVLNILAFDI